MGRLWEVALTIMIYADLVKRFNILDSHLAEALREETLSGGHAASLSSQLGGSFVSSMDEEKLFGIQSGLS